MQKTALVCGAGGFIGSHLVKRLKAEGCWVRGVNLKNPDFGASAADDFVLGDLREQSVCKSVLDRPFDEVYQLAADMGGAGYIFTGEHDADVMHNSATINLAARALWAAGRNQEDLLLIIRMHVPRIQPGGPREPELQGIFCLPCRSGQRIRLGKVFQREALSRIQ